MWRNLQGGVKLLRCRSRTFNLWLPRRRTEGEPACLLSLLH